MYKNRFILKAINVTTSWRRFVNGKRVRQPELDCNFMRVRYKLEHRMVSSKQNVQVKLGCAVVEHI